jgi:hypothetical protein
MVRWAVTLGVRVSFTFTSAQLVSRAGAIAVANAVRKSFFIV